jgi:hypothetical protein
MSLLPFEIAEEIQEEPRSNQQPGSNLAAL